MFVVVIIIIIGVTPYGTAAAAVLLVATTFVNNVVGDVVINYNVDGKDKFSLVFNSLRTATRPSSNSRSTKDASVAIARLTVARLPSEPIKTNTCPLIDVICANYIKNTLSFFPLYLAKYFNNTIWNNFTQGNKQ